VKPNVFIKARRNGKLFFDWAGHNTWTQHGRQYLASVLAYASYGPDTPVVPTSRIKYVAVGVGGKQHGALPGAVATAYPAGFDPNATTGDKYNHTFPESPLISTLERPARFSGGTNPYGSAAPGDVWLSTPALPKFFTQRPGNGVLASHLFIDGAAGDVAYGALPSVPLSEAGLVLSGDANVNTPFNPVVAYIDFPPKLTITNVVEAELTWLVGS
jgi:hypothetical protein